MALLPIILSYSLLWQKNSIYLLLLQICILYNIRYITFKGCANAIEHVTVVSYDIVFVIFIYNGKSYARSF